MDSSIMIDTELLIRAVKRHPALYKKSDPTYFFKSRHKPKIWQEVCRDVIQNWEQLKPQDRVGLGEFLRWLFSLFVVLYY